MIQKMPRRHSNVPRPGWNVHSTPLQHNQHTEHHTRDEDATDEAPGTLKFKRFGQWLRNCCILQKYRPALSLLPCNLAPPIDVSVIKGGQTQPHHQPKGILAWRPFPQETRTTRETKVQSIVANLHWPISLWEIETQSSSAEPSIIYIVQETIVLGTMTKPHCLLEPLLL